MGSFVQAIGTIKQGQDAAAAGDFNAAMKEQAATGTLQQAGQDEVMQRRSVQMALGDQAAAMGEAGVAGSPTSEAVQRQSSINAELDSLNIRYKGALSAWGLRQQAALDRMEGKNARTTSYLMAGSQLLKGAEDAAKYF